MARIGARQGKDLALRSLLFMLGSSRRGVTLVRSEFEHILEAWTDTDWASCPWTRRSMSAVMLRMFGMPLALWSGKQKTVALSSTMAETIGMSEGAKKTVAVRRMAANMKIKLPPTPMFVDNQAAKAIAENTHKLAELARYIAVRHLYVQELVRRRVIALVWVPSNENLADIGTKALDGVKFDCVVQLIFSYL